MIALWMAYALITGLWAALVGLALEHASRAMGIGTRWAWATATGLAVAFPVFRLVAGPESPVSTPGYVSLDVLEAGVVSAATSAPWFDLKGLPWKRPASSPSSAPRS